MRRISTIGSRYRALLLVGVMGTLALGLTACYPGGPESLDDLGLIVSFKNPEANYAGLRTFKITDEVIDLGEGNSGTDPLDPELRAAALSALEAEMIAAGFVLEENPNVIPDVWLDAGAVVSEVWVTWYNWGYPGWGYYYPPYVSAASFEQGSIIWMMKDLRGITDPDDPGNRAPVLWLAGINGALDSKNAATIEKIRTGVKQGFAQSPYIIAAPPTKRSGQEVE